jgi:hypothetical protein
VKPEKLLLKKNWDVIVSPYDHMGQLIYAAEFPLLVMYADLERQIKEAEEKKKPRSVACFTWPAFDDDRLIVHFLRPDAERFLSKGHYRMLRDRNKK